MRRALAAFVFAFTLAAPALAQSSLDDYDKARAALQAVWDGMPLMVRNVTLIEAAAPAYGSYDVHPGQSYRPGDDIHVYVEVLGYGWKDNGDGTQSELLDADLNVLDGAGKLIGQQLGFLNADIRSRQKQLETYYYLSANLSSLEPGEYGLQFVLHDRAAGKSATFEVPVTLVPSDASLPSAPAQ